MKLTLIAYQRIYFLSEYMKSFLIFQTFPLIPGDAVLRRLDNAPVDVWKEGESSVAPQLNETVIGALIKLLTIGLMRHE